MLLYGVTNLSGGAFHILLENNNKRLLLFGMLQEPEKFKKSNP